MPIKVCETQMTPDSPLEVVLDVSVLGNDVTVAPGTFKVDNQEYVLTESYTYTATPEAPKTHLMGYLVEQVADATVAVLVDRFDVKHPEDIYKFTPGGDPKKLFRLFEGTIPANEGLEFVRLQVYHVVVATPPAPDSAPPPPAEGGA